MIVLALKLVLAPLLVVASSLAGRRLGPRLAGILVVLPIVAGPILLVVHLQHGARFAAQAASAATLGIVPLALFVMVIAYASRRVGWVATMLVSWLAVLLVDVGLAQVHVPAGVALALGVTALHGAGLILRRLGAPAPRPTRPPRWDLPARAVATGLLVLILTDAAAALGPALTGVLAPFPIALSVVCAFALAQGGHAAVLALLRGIVPGLDGFALFCFLVAVTLEPLGAAAGFGLATAASVAVALILATRPTLPKPPRANV